MLTVKERVDILKEKGLDLLLVGYGGSYAYGTNVATSDIDIRGIYRNPLDELIGIKKDSEQFIDNVNDTVVYSLKKSIGLLCDVNPNTIEILGLRPQDYFYVSRHGKLLLQNASLFLSKRAVYTFGGYAKSQLNRLVNRSGRGKEQLVENEGRSIEKALSGIKYRYKAIDNSSFETYVTDDTVYMSMSFSDVPLETMLNIMNEVAVIHKDYKKSVRNDKAILHNKLNKHAMHLIRLYMMGIDLLEKHEIRTYREGNDHDLLMAIRNGDYLKEDGATPTPEFEKLIKEYETRFYKAAEETTLPDEPDYSAINKLILQINTER